MKTSAKPVKAKAILFIGYRHKNESIHAARQAGFKTVLITKNITPEIDQTLFDDLIFKDILNPEDLDELTVYLKRHYVVKSVISNYEHYVVPRSYLAERLEVPSCSVYSACCTRNKAMQRHALSFMKENIDYRVVNTKKQALEAFKALGGEVFIKSIAGIKSRLVFRVRTKREVLQFFDHVKALEEELDSDLYEDYTYCDFNFKYPNPKNTFLLEKAVQGQEITVESLVGSQQIWHAPSICDVYPASAIGREDSFLAYRITPSRQSAEVIKKAKKVAETAIRILGLQHGSVHTQLVITPAGDLKLIEVASRMGGYRCQMYQEAYGIHLSELLIKTVLGKKIRLNNIPHKYVSLVEIFAQEEGWLKSVRNLDELKNDAQVKNIILKANPGDKVGLAKNGFGPVMNFVITGDHYEEVRQKSEEYQLKLEVNCETSISCKL